MKKILKITFVSLIILFSSISVDAASCSSSYIRIMTGEDRYFDKIGLVPQNACTATEFTKTDEKGKVTGEDVESTVGACLAIEAYYTEDDDFHEGIVNYSFDGKYRDKDDAIACPKSNVKATLNCSYKDKIYYAATYTDPCDNFDELDCKDNIYCTWSNNTCSGDGWYKCNGIYNGDNPTCYYYEPGSYSYEVTIGNVESISDYLDREEYDCTTYDDHYSCSCWLSNYYMNYDIWTRTCTKQGRANVYADGYQFYLDSGDRAYCINPGYSYSSNKPYKLNVDFDVSKCKNSLEYTLGKQDNKTCGFSNVLIEGTRLYSGYSEEKRSGILYTALRFWAAYGESKFSDRLKGYSLTQDGYRGSGLPMRSAGDDVRYFLGPFTNTYVETLKAIFAGKYFDDGIDIFEVKSINDLQELKCGDAELGQMCGTNYGYLEAVYLFVNTYQGNDLMIDHLKELVGAANDEIVPYTPVSIKTTVDKELGEIQIIYEMNEVVEKECNDEDLNKDYCKANQKIVMVDDNGNKLINDITENYYDYCQKSFCYKTIEYTKLCNEKTIGTSQEVTITVTTEKTTISNTIKPYFTGTDYQSMYVIDLNNDSCTYDGTEINSNKFKYNIIKETVYDICEPPEQNDCCLITTTNVGNDYRNTVYATTPDGNTYTSSTIVSNPNTCVGKGNFYTDATKSQYNGVSVSSVGDPSLDCLVNLCYPADKAKYEYTELYNVNPDVCRIMCRDEIKFVLANKTTIYAGMQFKYDIEPIALNKKLISRDEQSNKKLNAAITGIVLQQRECVSEIYYDEEHKNDKDTYWLEMYEEAISHNNVTDALQLVYDLANCNLYSTYNTNKLINPDDLSENDIKRYNYISAYNCKDGPCTTFDYLNEKFSSVEFGGSVKVNNTTYGDSEYGNTAKLESIEGKTYTSIPKYCKDSSAKEKTDNKESCFDYLKNNPTSVDNKQNKKYDTNSNTVKIQTILSSTKIDIPVNDYAIFTLTNETDFYNATKYQVQNQTGKVTKITDNTLSADNIALKDYVYPVSLDTVQGSYDISYTFDFTPFTRNRKLDTFTELLDIMSTYTCSYDVYNMTIKYPKCYKYDEDGKIVALDDGQCYGFEYRNVDLKNMFPSGRKGTNWSTTYAQDIASTIKSESDDIFIDEDLLEYSFVLSTDAISAIREYNNGKDYISTQKGLEFDNSLYNCDKESGMFLNCQSAFLHTANLEELGVVILKDESKTKGSIKEVEE